jgi:hypothetical protein
MPQRHLPPFPPLDPVPLKDMARSLRFVAERGGRTLRDTLPIDALPEPAARLADGALASVLRLGGQAQRGVSDLAHRLLDRDDPPPPLTGPDAAEAESRFAAAAHDGLRVALRQLGAEDSLIRETTARHVWAAVFAQGPKGSEGATAAALFQALEAAHVIRETVWPEAAALPPAEARRIALFAVLLAMLADPADFHSRLHASVDLALALRADIAAAPDETRLAALFDEFRDHV